ncbi:beta-ketoacyl synthase N-terminal-like domain-containing protein [Aquimarina agarivorans]|uniref:beta-ketoacyl synthase N-terminal-like domain-containing protein n=1 Tax=Aquimarina agarivorans TaxID=980584 RepID=UPI000248EB5A|nr:beta-ketoacyl synthase N-terminal-like domain-containing protein [Aquimarina agarivorans]
MNSPISITGFASISPLGSTPEEIWETYLQLDKHCIDLLPLTGEDTAVAPLKSQENALLESVKQSVSHYANVDRSVLMGLFAARKAMKNAGWKKNSHFGINMGSSRGATELFEKYHKEYLKTNKTSTLSSPTTTLGNLSSWIANDLETKGPEISHSITCSTALHSVLNGVAWLTSGLTDKFMVGGSEAPLTPFTVAQMKALKIYTQHLKVSYPCRTLDLNKKRNQMFLGEGAAVFCLEKGIKANANAVITGIGYATEPLTHNISISANADCFQASIKMALGATPLNEVDAIVMHAPGTIKGDSSEYNAIRQVFQQQIPFLTSNKWKIGHSFGASGALSMELAILMLTHQKAIPVPFIPDQQFPKKLKTILINAVGFGGNAVTIKLELPNYSVNNY